MARPLAPAIRVDRDGLKYGYFLFPFPGLAAMKVLLVEDDPTVCMTLRGYLEKRGFGCDVAVNTEEALTMLERGSYSLILLDMSLPGSSELDTARSISRFGLKTTILALIDENSRVKFSALRRAGVKGYITKPVSQAAFDSLIDQHTK